MKKEEQTIVITLCGPGDVTKEIEIAEELITEWNRTNWDATGCGLRSRHWRSSTTPDLAERAQRVIDRQMIDGSDLVVGIFWSRLGTPTGLAESGTVEEIDRALHKDIRTMIYFSDLEALNQHVEEEQAAALEVFRKKVYAMGSTWSFANRRKFENDFRLHLGRVVHEILAKRAEAKAEVKRPRRAKTTISQNGTGNVQLVGDGNTLKPVMPSKPKIVIEQSPDQLTASEQKKVSDWIAELADLTSEIEKQPVGAAKRAWWSRLMNRFDVPRYNALESSRLGDVEKWYEVSKRNLTRTPRAKRFGFSDADWKKAIKTMMGKMGRTNEDYYPEIAVRLKIPRITSLTKLSSKRLEKVYNLVRRDSKK